MRPVHKFEPWRPIANHPFEACSGVAGMLTGTVGLIQPHVLDSAAVGHVTGSALPYWTILYLLASVMLFYGLLRSMRVEAAGLLLTIAAVLIQAVAVIVYHGWSGIITSSSFVGIGWGALIRVRVIYWLDRELKRSSQP